MAQLWCSYKLFATTQCILLSIQSSLFLTLATRHTVYKKVAATSSSQETFVFLKLFSLPSIIQGGIILCNRDNNFKDQMPSDQDIRGIKCGPREIFSANFL